MGTSKILGDLIWNDPNRITRTNRLKRNFIHARKIVNV